MGRFTVPTLFFFFFYEVSNLTPLPKSIILRLWLLLSYITFYGFRSLDRVKRTDA